MRDLVSMARRLLETRKTVKQLEQDAQGRGEVDALSAARLMVYRGAMQALAWALEIDLDQMDSPSLSNLLANEHPDRVRLHRVDVTGQDGATRILWLTEIPAHRDRVDPSFTTEYWSCFFSDAQARELYRALGQALPLPEFPVCTLPHPVVQAPVAPQPATITPPTPARASRAATARSTGRSTAYRSGAGPNGADVVEFPALPAAPASPRRPRPPQRGA